TMVKRQGVGQPLASLPRPGRLAAWWGEVRGGLRPSSSARVAARLTLASVVAACVSELPTKSLRVLSSRSGNPSTPQPGARLARSCAALARRTLVGCIVRLVLASARRNNEFQEMGGKVRGPRRDGFRARVREGGADRGPAG